MALMTIFGLVISDYARSRLAELDVR